MENSADVHAKSIRETLARAQQVIIGNYHRECLELAQTLSQSASRIGISEEVMRRIEQYRTLLPGSQAGTPSRHDRMPYRAAAGADRRASAGYLRGPRQRLRGPGPVPGRHRADHAQPAGQPRRACRFFPGAPPVVAHRYLRVSSRRAGPAAAHPRASRRAGAGTGRPAVVYAQRGRTAHPADRGAGARYGAERQLRCAWQAHSGGIRRHHAKPAPLRPGGDRPVHHRWSGATRRRAGAAGAGALGGGLRQKHRRGGA